MLFLGPALVLLGAIVVYPIFFSIGRSFFDANGSHFVGIDNYQEMFTSDATRTAIKNNLIWVVFAPSIVTALGLVFAVLTERVAWSTAFKVAIFMPMAISFLSAGVTWRLIYEQDPQIGLANATVGAVVDVVRPPGVLPGARPPRTSRTSNRRRTAPSSSPARWRRATRRCSVWWRSLLTPFLPTPCRPSRPRARRGGHRHGLAGLRARGRRRGRGDRTQREGLPGVDVEAVSDGEVVASATTTTDGTFALEGIDGDVQLRLPAQNFREPFAGINWLGPALVTPAIIASYIWIWAGFAMVVIAAGLAAIPRETWRLPGRRRQRMAGLPARHRPLLAPVLAVVLVTMIINVLKIFDLVLVIAPGSSQRDANVIALQLWKTAFGIRDFGLGSALAVFLLVLVLPAMAFNLRRFRREQD